MSAIAVAEQRFLGQGLNLGEIRTLTVEQVMGPPPAIAPPPKPEQ